MPMPELYFDQAQARLRPPSRAALDQLAAALRGLPALHLEGPGHTHNVSNTEFNRQLSQQRAEAARRSRMPLPHGTWREHSSASASGLRRHPARG